MTASRFIQIHSLHGYSAVLLNRDDSGLAKRIEYGGWMRTRISSQCLKRHWRVADSVHALTRIDGAPTATRSREIVTLEVMRPLREADHDEDVAKAVEKAFQTAVYGDKGDQRSNRQPLLLGAPEIEFLAKEASRIAALPASEAKAAAKSWVKDSRQNMKAMREQCRLPGGLVAALFGRMVTSDVEANIDAAVHVAHAFTVHREESESDYFTVVDDLRRIEDDPGADHIGETELTCGLFYGYVVVDRDILLRNLAGDSEMAGEVCRRLIHLIATVTPGAKLGSTAPYGYASWLMAEAGDRQPRSLAEAFRSPCRATTQAAESALSGHLERLDETYETGEARRAMSLNRAAMPRAELISLTGLADWAADVMERGHA
ncbi:type I-E CRISPR-associated protein Cas7/Cse4/CasC [Candidatus Palauibacter sp.]|uniref:type I-E CRISPR-associated protein Cas7/Cse4/CasC n=1 Tax=Candidatus Palauibacter sp. TaxID=3101350 RepID=UPI003B520719